MINKFNARKVEYKGMTFDSKKEFHRYLELKDMEKQGVIKGLLRQIEYIIIPSSQYFRETKYIADFVYRYNNDTVIEDVKGYRKGAAYQVFKIKQKLMYHEVGILVKEI